MKNFLTILLLTCASVFGAAGDIVGVAIGTDGWYADVTVSGLATGGTYAFGLGSNNTPETGTPKMAFSVVSLGYDDTGTATTISRTIWGTKEVRTHFSTKTIAGSFVLGTFVEGETITQGTTLSTAVVVVDAQAGGAKLIVRAVVGTPDNSHVWTGGTSAATFTPSATPVDYSTGPREFNDGTNVRVRVALSEQVYQKDNSGGGNSGTAITVNILSGFYTAGGTPNNSATALTVTNNSTAAYQKAVGNWSWPGYQLMDATTKLRCVAFHSSAQFGRMVRCVKFTVNDGSTTVTEIVTTPTIDRSMGDAVPVVEYVTSGNLVSGLTQGAVLTCNFIAYPWVGDSGATLDTSAGTTAPSPLYGPIKMVCDRTGAYGVTKVLVDPAGNDTSGVAYDSASFVEGTATPCLTINGACVKIAAYNNSNHSRNTLGGGVIYLKAGSYVWSGGSGSIGTTPDAVVTITRAASATRAQAIILGASGDADLTDRVKFLDVTLTETNNNTVINGCEFLWMDQCEIDQTGIANTGFALVYGAANWYMTRNLVTYLAQGIRPSSTQTTSPCLVRGNTLNLANWPVNSIFVYTVIGNATTGKGGPSGGLLTGFYAGQTIPTSAEPIIAFNKLEGLNAGSNPIYYDGHSRAITHGVAVVQNVFENYNTGSASLVGFAADGSGATASVSPCNNWLMWNNVFAGQRWNYAYDEYGANAPVRQFWSIKNNLTDDPNFKADLFSTTFSSITRVTTVATATTTTAHGLATGDIVTISGSNQSPYNGTFMVTVTSGTVFTYTMVSDPGSSSTGAASMLACAGRDRNWSVLYGVGSSGNLFTQITGMGATGLNQTFEGLNSPTAIDGVVLGYHKYFDRQAYDTSSAQNGQGNYRTHPASPSRNLQRDLVMPFDIAGNVRGVNAQAGAYVMAHPANFFLAQ